MVGDDEIEMDENAEESEEYDPREDMGSYNRDFEPDEWRDDAPYKDGLPICRYGPSCYRTNPEHFKEFSHPWANDS